MSPPDPTDVVERCLPYLTDAATDWENRGAQDAPLLVVCATPRAGLVVRAEGWPVIPPCDYTREVLTAALTHAVEAPASDENCRIALGAVSLLIDADGRDKHLADVTRIRNDEDGIPILAVMIADGEVVSFTANVACPAAPPPGSTVH